MLAFLKTKWLPGILLSFITLIHWALPHQGARPEGMSQLCRKHVGPGGETWFETGAVRSWSAENLSVSKHVKLKMEELFSLMSGQNLL